MPSLGVNFEELASLCQSFLIVMEDSYLAIVSEPQFEEFMKKLKQYDAAWCSQFIDRLENVSLTGSDF